MRGHSVTFAALFTLALLGFSVFAWLRRLLGALGAHWLVLLLLPGIVIALLARKEREWIPDEAERRKWARGLIFGSLVAAGLSAVFFPKPPAPKPDRPPVVLPTGPRGK